MKTNDPILIKSVCVYKHLKERVEFLKKLGYTIVVRPFRNSQVLDICREGKFIYIQISSDHHKDILTPHHAYFVMLNSPYKGVFQ